MRHWWPIWLCLVLLGAPAASASDDPAQAPAPPRPERVIEALRAEPNSAWLHVALGANLTAQGMDLAITMYCLGQQSCHERNLLLSPFENRPLAFGAMKMGVVALENYLLWKMHRKHPKLTTWLAVGGAVGFTALSIHNARRLQ